MKYLIAGLGNMGLSHALAHHRNDASHIVGLVNRSGRVADPELADYPVFTDYDVALEKTSPDLVVIATYLKACPPNGYCGLVNDMLMYSTQYTHNTCTNQNIHACD